MSRVLDVAEAQLGRMERGHPPDATLLQLAVDYFAGYSDECHHPKEDLVFRKLRARVPEVAGGLTDLLREHAQLRQVSLELSRRVDPLRSGFGTVGEPLIEGLRHFLRTNRAHIEAEERDFFPVVSRSLTDEDLAEIDFLVLDRPDPLVDRGTEARFKRLRDEIDRRADAAARATAHASARWRKDEAALLRGPSDVSRFNALWSERGARLVRLRAGGYSLERDGARIAHVPDCSEERAVWCALFYLMGEGASEGASEPTPGPALPAPLPRRQAGSTAR